MDTTRFLATLDDLGVNYIENEPMFKHTTFKTGGIADIFIKVKSVCELKTVIKHANEEKIPFFIIGKGSNLLVSDSGIRGVVICLADMDNIEVCGDRIIADAGVPLSALCIKARDNGLTGLEFAYGIPGVVGGAVFMNAGAYGGEMSQVIDTVRAINCCGVENQFSLDLCDFGYRTSVFKNDVLIVTQVEFKLKKGNISEITDKMNELLEKRKTKQPLSFPSAGSTFKRPEGNFAGALIEKNNLKGKKIGGAMVSELHAGFIINYDSASTADILKLMRYVQETVYKNDGVLLEPEVLYVGEPPLDDILPYKNASEIL